MAKVFILASMIKLACQAVAEENGTLVRIKPVFAQMSYDVAVYANGVGW